MTNHEEDVIAYVLIAVFAAFVLWALFAWIRSIHQASADRAMQRELMRQRKRAKRRQR